MQLAMIGLGRMGGHMVQRLLALPELPEPPDAADALAVALCHIRHDQVERNLASLGS